MHDDEQPSLFGPVGDDPSLPEGFKYAPLFISREDESELVRQIQTLQFKEFEFRGFLGKRRVVSFGWKYDFNDRELQKADEMPEFLLALRDIAADFAALKDHDFKHVLVTEYSPGAGIGWHKDKAVFDKVVGISLLEPCRFRLRRKQGTKWERTAITAEPRSAYLLAGPSRTQWEHSIPPMERLRYSITFRNFVQE